MNKCHGSTPMCAAAGSTGFGEYLATRIMMKHLATMNNEKTYFVKTAVNRMRSIMLNCLCQLKCMHTYQQFASCYTIISKKIYTEHIITALWGSTKGMGGSGNKNWINQYIRQLERPHMGKG